MRSAGSWRRRRLEELGYHSPVPDWAEAASSSTVHVSNFGRNNIQIATVTTNVPVTTVQAVLSPEISDEEAAETKAEVMRLLIIRDSGIAAKQQLVQANLRLVVSIAGATWAAASRCST